jgi:hypothetical protein
MTRDDALEMLRAAFEPGELGLAIDRSLHEKRIISDSVSDQTDWNEIELEVIEWLAEQLTDEQEYDPEDRVVG